MSRLCKISLLKYALLYLYGSISDDNTPGTRVGPGGHTFFYIFLLVESIGVAYPRPARTPEVGEKQCTEKKNKERKREQKLVLTMAS